MQNKVFEEWNHILVQSSYGELNGKKRYYRVCLGSVTWRESDPGQIHKACFPVVQFGETRDYNEAMRNREIKLDYPCHILMDDLEKVMVAMDELKNIK